MGKAQGLMAVAILLVASGASAADSGAHYYMARPGHPSGRSVGHPVGHPVGKNSSHRSSGSHAHPGGSRKAAGVPRDSHGRIHRSAKAREQFKHNHPCPATGKSSGPCHGYVIDHVVPLKRGGADNPSNMQWQTTAAARQKDRTE